MDNEQHDWQYLADINFLIHRRITDHLNKSLGAVNLIDTQGEGEYWKEHSKKQILRTMHLYNAWNELIRFHSGQRGSTQRQFRACDFMEWLAYELQQPYQPNPDHERVLFGTRETLQEALLLLHSAVYTLGPCVRVITQTDADGMWFRVRYTAFNSAPPASYQAMIEMLSGDWRAELTAFELTCAQNFLLMNDCPLVYEVEENEVTLGFFVPTLSAARAKILEAASGEIPTQTAIPSRPIPLEEAETKPYRDSAIGRRMARGQTELSKSQS